MQQYIRLSKYRVVWLVVFFDLPVTKKTERKAATLFRKTLMQDGFAMMQFSVYTRHCASKESANVHIARARRITPSLGHVSILQVTDKQYGNIVDIWGKREKALPPSPKQLEMF